MLTTFILFKPEAIFFLSESVIEMNSTFSVGACQSFQFFFTMVLGTHQDFQKCLWTHQNKLLQVSLPQIRGSQGACITH
jgi:hypothetical protein